MLIFILPSTDRKEFPFIPLHFDCIEYKYNQINVT